MEPVFKREEESEVGLTQWPRPRRDNVLPVFRPFISGDVWIRFPMCQWSRVFPALTVRATHSRVRAIMERTSAMTCFASDDLENVAFAHDQICLVRAV